MIDFIFFAMLATGLGVPILYVINYFARESILAFLSGRDKYAVWKGHLASHGLSFMAATLPSDDSCVLGDYRGHHLALDLYPEDKQDYTHLMLRANNPTADPPPEFQQTTTDANRYRALIGLLIPNGIPDIYGILEVTKQGQVISFKEKGILKDSKYLKRICDLMGDLADGYTQVLSMQGEIVPTLELMSRDQEYILQKIGTQLLLDIAAITTHKLEARAPFLLCPFCLTLFQARKARLIMGETATYYGCRNCGQSRTFLEGAPIAVLDAGRDSNIVTENNKIEINWLSQRSLFDFYAIDIRHSNDEAVERFAVQIGNDTDAWRKEQYKNMRCTIAANCQLSPNTIRILEQMLGDVTYVRNT